MKRLTSNRTTSDMSIIELAHNSCYADENNNARYRDYNLDIDSRKLVKSLIKDMCNDNLYDMSDEDFDEYMAEMLSVEMDSQIGLLALFYRNLWAMADLRERLKYYEDLEEQDRLLKLPCKVGDTVYEVNTDRNIISTFVVTRVTIYPLSIQFNWKLIDGVYKNIAGFADVHIGETVFLTKEEAEAKLKELRGEA